MSVKILLWYDVEDYVNPIADEALLEVITMMEELGIRSSLKVVGEKARVLQARGRTDILKKIAGQEVCYHTNDHSRHPTVVEYGEKLGFREGALAFEEKERGGFTAVRDITGQAPTSYGQPGLAWSPQIFPVLRKWGISSYLDSHTIMDVDGGAFWYGGVLMLTRLHGEMRYNYENKATGLEDAKKQFKKLVTGNDKTKIISIYYHPCEFACEEFWDSVNFAHGKNSDTFSPSRLRTTEERAEILHNLREFLQYTLTFDDVEYLTASEIMKQEEVRKHALSRGDLAEYANSFTGNIDYAFIKGAYLSASELFSLMARYLCGKHLISDFLYAPEMDTPSELATELVSTQELAEAALTQYERVMGYQQMPSLYRVGENRLNARDMYTTLVRAIQKGENTVEIVTGGILKAAEKVNTDDNYSGRWLLPEKFTIPNIIRQTQLQTWTLKPALF